MRATLRLGSLALVVLAVVLLQLADSSKPAAHAQAASPTNVAAASPTPTPVPPTPTRGAPTATPRPTTTGTATPTPTGAALPAWVLALKPPSERWDSQLWQLFQAHQQGALAEKARGMGLQPIQLDGDRVLASIIPEPGQAGAAAAAVAAAGGRVTGRSDDLNHMEAYVPVAALPSLVQAKAIRWSALTPLMLPAALSQGVAQTHAQAWHDAGFTGAGVKVGIIDIGFTGYDALRGQDLPATVDTTCSQVLPADGGDEPGKHGTGVAEIVYDMAPSAQLFLARALTAEHMSQAENCLAGKEVQIINYSGGWIYNRVVGGPGNGTGPVNDTVNRATSRVPSIFWANSAGNQAQNHWRGDWNDPDNNSRLNFSGNDERQDVFIAPGGTINVALRWNDPWGGGCNDYDLWLWDDAGQLVERSDTRQVCPGGPPPVDSLSHTSPAGGWHYIEVVRVGGASPNVLELMTYGHPLEYKVASHSLIHPADNASTGMASVGSVTWCNEVALELVSSQGPTTDGRTKPDLVGHSYVDTAIWGPSNNCTSPNGFYGTSAASPHVAGAAALVKFRYPTYTASGIKGYLQGWGVDLGPAGADNQYGWGRLNLPPPTPPAIGTITPTRGWSVETAISMTGSDFGSGATVTVGATPATDVSVPNGTYLTGRTPWNRPLGDVNGNGMATSLDALCILRFVAGLPETTSCPAAKLTTVADVTVRNPNGQSGTRPGGFTYYHADVNANGSVTAVDALCTLRLVAALPATAACPRPGGAGPAGPSGAGLSSLDSGSPVSVDVQPSAATVAPGGSVSITVQATVPAGSSL
ncbi:MAG: S8 family serine peptidase, partial [Chloroflexi bacterium]|nr:S8 family serine peptidase [Chloroflexota bacterium]